jgi:hypothetical protein
VADVVMVAVADGVMSAGFGREPELRSVENSTTMVMRGELMGAGCGSGWSV